MPTMNLHLRLIFSSQDDGVKFFAGEDYKDSHRLIDGVLTPADAVKFARTCDDLTGYDGDAPGPLEKKVIRDIRAIAAELPDMAIKQMSEGARKVALGKAIAEALPTS